MTTPKIKKENKKDPGLGHMLMNARDQMGRSWKLDSVKCQMSERKSLELRGQMGMPGRGGGCGLGIHSGWGA